MSLHSRCVVYFGLVFSLVLATPGMAQDSVEDMLREMKEDMKQLREENKGMRVEIDDLRALNDEDWLTGQRAEEIRGLVADVLADADTRSNLAGDGLLAGHSEHFFLASRDGRFKLQLDGQMQVRFLYRRRENTIDRHRGGFENTRTKLTFRGHVFSRDWTYLVRGGFGRGRTPTQDSSPPNPDQKNDFALQDAWGRFHINDNWSIRFGQFKLPFNREELVDSSNQLAVERSVVNEHLNLGRSQGVELTRATQGSRFIVSFTDGGTDNSGVSLTSLNPVNTTSLTKDTEWAFTGRYERLLAGSWGQFNDFTSPMIEEYAFMVGVGIHAERGERLGQGGRKPDWYGYTIDLSAEWGGANAFASFTHHYVDRAGLNINLMGIVVQGGLYITPKTEIFGRMDYGWWNGEESANFIPVEIATVGVNYYLDGHDLKWTTDIGVAFSRIQSVWTSDLAGFEVENASGFPQVVFRTQFQLLF